MAQASPEEMTPGPDAVGSPSDWIRRVAPTRLSGSVVEQFRELVATGRLVPGQRLPNERELAEMFGVSRTSVREALRQLEMLTIVESRRGDGTYVRELDVAQLMAPLGAVMATSATAMHEVLEFRRTFEPEVAALAALKVGPKDKEDLEEALRIFEESVDSPGAEIADVDFHFAVAAATHNGVIVGVQRALMEVMAQFRAHLDPVGYHGTDAATGGHRAIVEAIQEGDPVLARAAAISHLEFVATVLVEPDEVGPGPA